MTDALDENQREKVSYSRSNTQISKDKRNTEENLKKIDDNHGLL